MKTIKFALALGLLLAAAALVGCQAAQPTQPATETACALDCAVPPAEISSLSGAFRLSYTSDAGRLPLNEMHTWTLHVETADGAPVEDALITVDGGMPAHNHGLPTSPAVTMYLGDGNYRVEGMKFHMGGDWVVDFEITVGDVTDTARFDVVIQ